MDQVTELARVAWMPLDPARPDVEVLTMLASWCGVERTRELIEAGEVFTQPLPMDICNHPQLRVIRRA